MTYVGYIYNQERSAELYENARLAYELDQLVRLPGDSQHGSRRSSQLIQLQVFAQGYSVSIRVGLGIEDTIIFNFDYTQPGWWKP